MVAVPIFPCVFSLLSTSKASRPEAFDGSVLGNFVTQHCVGKGFQSLLIRVVFAGLRQRQRNRGPPCGGIGISSNGVTGWMKVVCMYRKERRQAKDDEPIVAKMRGRKLGQAMTGRTHL